MMGDWDGGMGVAAWLLMTVFWVVLLAAVVWAVASLFPSRRDGSTVLPERPEDVLDRRLAHGEIDPATYDELRGKLRAGRAERV
jgi:putative membrane protein